MRRVALLLVVVGVLTAGCSSATTDTAGDEATVPTTAVSTTATASTATASTTTTSTTTTQPTTTDVASIGDAVHGHEIATVFDGARCFYCHTLDESEPLRLEALRTPLGPRLEVVSSIAGDRVPGLSAEEYLRQSILDPAAYVVEGEWSREMLGGLRYLLSEEDVNDLIAFLLSI